MYLHQYFDRLPSVTYTYARYAVWPVLVGVCGCLSAWSRELEDDESELEVAVPVSASSRDPDCARIPAYAYV